MVTLLGLGIFGASVMGVVLSAFTQDIGMGLKHKDK